MAINIAYLEAYLSGGAGNTDPNDSLGGVISSTKIASQLTTAIAALTGVTILYAAGNSLGVGTLSFIASTSLLSWTPFGGTPSAGQDVSVDGRYVLRSGAGYLAVDVDASSLPGVNTSANTTVSNGSNKLFDDVTGQESFVGDIEYRGFYYKNVHPSISFLGIDLQIIAPAVSVGSITVGVDPAGVGNGVSTGVMDIAPDENTAPGAYTEVSFGVPLPIAGLAPGECIGIWEKRTTPGVRTIIPNPPIAAHIRARAYWA